MSFQSTRLLTKRLKIRLKVSIHFLFFVTRFDRLVSIHIPTFQLTRPQGAQAVEFKKTVKDLIVSIHAPARGTSPSCRARSSQWWRFNSRMRAGRKMQQSFLTRYIIDYCKFQLTHMREMQRRAGIWIYSSTSRFNSLACARCNAPSECIIRPSTVSIHSRVRDVTFLALSIACSRVFQSTRMREM